MIASPIPALNHEMIFTFEDFNNMSLAVQEAREALVNTHKENNIPIPV